MNKEEIKKRIEVMQGYVEGKTIQFKPKFEKKFIDHDPDIIIAFDWNIFDYRVKPDTEETDTPQQPNSQEDNKTIPPLPGLFGLDVFKRILDMSIPTQQDFNKWRDIHTEIITSLIDGGRKGKELTREANDIMLSMLVFEEQVLKNPNLIREAITNYNTKKDEQEDK